jgi:hypothetical protein
MRRKGRERSQGAGQGRAGQGIELFKAKKERK